MTKLTDKKLDAMIVAVITTYDYDLGKTLDPNTSELTAAEIAAELRGLRRVARKHLERKP